jgi:hypothetical protein
MRVSTTFKELAAPFLYERLDWKHVERNALRLDKVGRRKKDRSDIVPKEEEVKHIRSIEITRHASATCPMNVNRSRQDPLVVPLLRVDASKDDHLGLIPSNTCLGERTCPILKNIAPKKLLLIPNSRHEKIHFGRLNDEFLEDVIINVNLYDVGTHSGIFESLPVSKRYVLVVSASEPIENDDESVLEVEYGTRHEDFSRQGRLIVLVWHLAMSARHGLSSWLLVSCFGDRDVAHEPTPKDLQMLDDVVSRTPGRSWTELGRVLRTAKGMEMGDYLSSPDWQGVYTDDEVAQMLEAERASAEREETRGESGLEG